ncbi:hypothetical protein JPH1_41880 [Mycobacterium avium subsp. hominissuis]|uniref:Uncharacterized protein n=1 Tax=Mycobacterium avium subsp. hominissuis TaxID=439334 RepID=A0AAI8X4E6_MYCAV|nr:hypothetical protein JPH1_41880 [Mycobacterium avium subsp. hominissuis]
MVVATVGRAVRPVPGRAETEPVLAEWFLRRFSLLDSLYLIPPPRIVGRAVGHNMRLWLGQRRRAGRPGTATARPSP